VNTALPAGGHGGVVPPGDTAQGPTTAQDPATVDEVARATLEKARDHLLGLQFPDGYWHARMETNVTMDAEDLLFRHFLGILTPEQAEGTGKWVRGQRRDDGTWATYYGGPGDLSTTVEAYLALRLAGDQPDEPHMKQTADWITENGGLAATRVFTRMWLAMSGLWSWDDLPVIPAEIIYLPSWFPLNIYDWGCWARQTVVALAVVSSFKPSRPVPFTVDELASPRGENPPQTPPAHGGTTRPPVPPWGRPSAPLDPWAAFFDGLDVVLHQVQKVYPKFMRRAALRRCTEWIIARQEKDGCWGGIQPPWVYSLIGLHLMGYGLDHPVMRKGIEGLDRFTVIEDDGSRWFEACQSPVWDTVLTMIALADAGLPADHPALVKGAEWVLDEEIFQRGDWQVRRPDIPAGGWAFEFDNDNYADTDDTAEVILALRRVDLSKRGSRAAGNRAAIDRGLRWLEGMQCKDGGWGAFDADNTRELITKVSFCDFGAVIDPPSADVTAHIVEALAHEGLASEKACRRGVIWLLKNQEPDGSWFGRWGANYVYGTGAVVPALIAAGVKPGKPQIRAAVSWLEAHQNDDGGWGEDMRSYDDPGQWAGRGESTSSQTAWALLALLAAGERDSAAVERGVRYLAETQREDGTWDQALFTGTGFPGDFYLNYRMYRLAFPVSALGRFVCE
jgi:squalene-hopene/tetraprenyl-beta-curcumene cyclase